MLLVGATSESSQASSVRLERMLLRTAMTAMTLYWIDERIPRQGPCGYWTHVAYLQNLNKCFLPVSMRTCNMWTGSVKIMTEDRNARRGKNAF